MQFQNCTVQTGDRIDCLEIIPPYARVSSIHHRYVQSRQALPKFPNCAAQFRNQIPILKLVCNFSILNCPARFLNCIKLEFFLGMYVLIWSRSLSGSETSWPVWELVNSTAAINYAVLKVIELYASTVVSMLTEAALKLVEWCCFYSRVDNLVCYQHQCLAHCDTCCHFTVVNRVDVLYRVIRNAIERTKTSCWHPTQCTYIPRSLCCVTTLRSMPATCFCPFLWDAYLPVFDFK